MFYITGLYRQWSDGQGVVVVPTTPSTPDVGHVSRQHGEYRRRYILDDGRHVFLTLEELRAYLLTRLERKQKKAKPSKRAAKAAPQQAPAGPAAKAGILSESGQPTYPAVPRFDELWAQGWVQRQPEVMAVLRELAQRLELAADDEDVEILLLS